MKIIAITNEKGGVGKTTISAHLAHSLVKDGHKVAFVDADGQGNASRFLSPFKSKSITAHHFFSEPINNIEDNNLVLLPSTRTLFSINKLFRGVVEDNVNFLNICGFDYLIFDTSPAMSKCSIACMIVSDMTFSPVNMSDFAFDGVAKTIDTIKQVRDKNSSNVVLAGLIPNLINTKSKVQMTALNNLLLAQPGKIMPFLASRSPYTDVMNGNIPLWKMKPMAGNVKVANHELSRLLESMKTIINVKEVTNAC